jgi:hypothetical protein
MSMTATDFRALASILAEHWASPAIVNAIADHCEDRNHLFDRARFLDECGIESTDHNHHEVRA